MDANHPRSADRFSTPGHVGKRRALLAAAAVAGLVLSGCDGVIASAGKVTHNGSNLVAGSFKLQRWPIKWGAIKSDGTGGACLMVAMNEVPGYEQMKCTGADRSCGPAPANGLIARLWDVRCDLDADAAADAVGQCWGRPFNRPPEFQLRADRQSCHLSRDYQPDQRRFVLDEVNHASHDELDLSDPLYQGLAKPSHWRVWACVRAQKGLNVPFKCEFGDVTEVPGI